MTRCIGYVVAVLLFLAIPSPASADIREGSVELGAYLFRANFDDESNIENDEGFGGRLGFAFSSQHGLEFNLDHVETGDEFGLGLEVDITTLKAGYVYNFVPDGVVSPLLTVGGGFQRLRVSEETIFGNEELTDETDPMGFAGLGVRFFIGPVFNIRIDGRAQAVLPDGDPDDALVDGVLEGGIGWVIGG